jgi:TolB-like protein/DNA-binding winged helix-turn-helix (wHTH) protein/Flp pilus assembly protein TadD
LKPLPDPDSVICFAAFEVELRSGELRKRGRKIRLQDQPFRVLAILLERPGEVVTRDELHQRLWPADTFVDFNHGLNNAINRLREALSDSAETPLLIETLPRRGYRFIAPVRVRCEFPRFAEAQPQQGPSSRVLSEPLIESVVTNNVAPSPQSASPAEMEGHASVGERKSNRDAIRTFLGWRRTALLTVLVAGIATGLLMYQAHRQNNAALPETVSLIVLPFQNLSGNSEQEYFVDGMTDELITELAKIRSLRVISRTSAMRYKGAVKPLATIARDLPVDAVVEGTVLRSGDRLRITAQLIRVVPEQHLWAESYERDLRDVLALQRDVARAIVHEIQIKLSVREQARLANPQPAVNTEAHELYLKGLYFWNQRTEIGLKKSVEYFQKAVEKDSGYALAYAGLANSYNLLGGFSVLPSAQAFPKAEAAATAALALDSELAEAHTSLGYARLKFDWNWAAAEKELKLGVELRPNDATAHAYYGLYFRTMGRAQEAIAEMRRARELDPLSLDNNAQFGVTYRDGRYYDQAVEQCRKALELDPNFEMAHWCLGLAYVGKGMYEEAVPELRTAVATGGCPCKLAALGYTYAITGDRVRAQGILRDLKIKAEQGYQLSYLIAEVYAGLRDYEQAFDWLNKAYNQRDCQLTWLNRDPFMESLRSDPRYADLMHRVGFQ